MAMDISIVQLDQGLKLNTKIGLHTTHHPPHHHPPPQTFRALPDILGDLVCLLIAHKYEIIQRVMLRQSPSLGRSPSD